jgi:hypothetical protein
MRTGNIIRVKPTGVDDTANIQCAFDWAIARGPGMTIRLQPGTFHTAQIYAYDFIGIFRGSGKNHTTVVNLPELYVNPDIGRPSPDNPQPYLFVMFGGDYTFANMSIQAVGEKATSYWSWPGCPDNYAFHALIGVFPSQTMVDGIREETDAAFSQISMSGEPYATAHYGYNAIQGIYGLGVLDPEMVALSGNLSVNQSNFSGLAYSLAFFNMADATIMVTHSDFANTQAASEASDLVNTRVVFAHNRVKATVMGFDFLDYMLPMDVNSDYVVRNNVIAAPIGIAVYSSFDADSTCLIKVNNLIGVTDTPIYLSPGAEACVVKNNKQ